MMWLFYAKNAVCVMPVAIVSNFAVTTRDTPFLGVFSFQNNYFLIE